jgi:glycosyltransferase involved in cell wall biosynthesis
MNKIESDRKESYSDAMSVTVLIPVHGEAPYLQDAVESVINQDHDQWELLLVLDRPDKTLSTISEELGRRDERIKSIVSPGSGIVDALNFGLANAKFDLIARLDSDDLMMPARLTNQVLTISKSEQIACVGSQMSYIDEAGRTLGCSSYPLSHQKIKRHLLYQNCLGHPSVMFRKKAVISLGGYRKILTGVEDYDLWLRLSRKFILTNSELQLTRYRISNNQYSKTFGDTYTILEEAARLDFQFGFINHNTVPNIEDYLRQGIKSTRKKHFFSEPLKIIRSYQGLLVSQIVRILGSKRSKTMKLIRIAPYAIILSLVAPQTIIDLIKRKLRTPSK